MSWLRSDVMAIVCILGGAAAGGAATLAVLDSGHRGHVRCGVEMRGITPTIAISHGGGAHAIVVTPDVQLHSVRDCVSNVHEVVEIHMDNHLRHLDAQMEQMDQVLDIQLEGLEAQIEAEVEAELAKVEAELAELEAQLEAEFHFQVAKKDFDQARMRMVIERVGGGGN